MYWSSKKKKKKKKVLISKKKKAQTEQLFCQDFGYFSTTVTAKSGYFAVGPARPVSHHVQVSHSIIFFGDWFWLDWFR